MRRKENNEIGGIKKIEDGDSHCNCIFEYLSWLERKKTVDKELLATKFHLLCFLLTSTLIFLSTHLLLWILNTTNQNEVILNSLDCQNIFTTSNRWNDLRFCLPVHPDLSRIIFCINYCSLAQPSRFLRSQ